MPKPLQTARLDLRPFKPSDYDFMRPLHSNVRVKSYIGSWAPMSSNKSEYYHFQYRARLRTAGQIRILNAQSENQTVI